MANEGERWSGRVGFGFWMLRSVLLEKGLDDCVSSADPWKPVDPVRSSSGRISLLASAILKRPRYGRINVET